MRIRPLTLTALALAAFAFGCTAPTANGGAESTDEAQNQGVTEELVAQNTAPAKLSHMRRRGGSAMLVSAALKAPLDLTAEQRTTIEAIASNGRAHLQKAHHAPDPAKKAAFAQSIREGKAPAFTKGADHEAAQKARQTRRAEAIAKLHATLTPVQRAKLVDFVEKNAEARRTQWKAHKGEHLAKTGEMKRREHRGFRGHGGFLKGIQLTDAQKEAVKAKIAESRAGRPELTREERRARFESMKNEMKAKLETFKSNTFDANAFVARPAAMKGFEKNNMRKAHMEAVLSVLTKEQREQLAQRIEQGPKAFQKPAALEEAETNTAE